MSALETTEAHDKHTIDTWKDELNNLLIFVRCPILLENAFSDMVVDRLILRCRDGLYRGVLHLAAAR